MLVRMKKHFTGSRNGEEWPPVGATIELPDHEAADMLSNGYVEEVNDAGSDEEAAPDSDEDAAGITGAADADSADGDPEAAPDGLEALDHDALIAFANEHELEVNHRLGEPKLRAAIREALEE